MSAASILEYDTQGMYDIPYCSYAVVFPYREEECQVNTNGKLRLLQPSLRPHPSAYEGAEEDAIPQKRRIRIDIKPIEHGNNQFGRNGVLRCAACRKWKRKCVYQSPWLPCEMCKIKKVDCPCIKLPPPHVTMVPPRQGPIRLPTPYNAVIEPRDALLLNGAFHGLGHAPLIASFFKQLARVYGELIPHAALRHAVLACTAAELLPADEGQERLDFHKQQASSHIQQLKSPTMIEDADVFAAFLLAWVTYRNSDDTGEGNVPESYVHAAGCGIMMRHVAENTKDTPFLHIFKGLVWDKVSWMVSTADISRLVSLTPMSSFGDRVRYFEQLCITGTPVGAWMSATLEAVNDYLCDLLRTSLVWLHDIAVEESASHVDERTVPVGTAEYIQERLSDPELRHVLSNLKQSLKFDNPSAVPDSDRQVIQLQFSQWRTIELLHSIFKSPTITQGLDTLETEMKAIELLHEMKFQPRLSASLTEYYYDYSFIGIAIAGLTIPREETLQREWIIAELEGVQMYDVVGSLKGWWQEGDIPALNGFVKSLFDDSWRMPG